jgi:hypothetical protein
VRGSNDPWPGWGYLCGGGSARNGGKDLMRISSSNGGPMEGFKGEEEMVKID